MVGVVPGRTVAGGCVIDVGGGRVKVEDVADCGEETMVTVVEAGKCIGQDWQRAVVVGWLLGGSYCIQQ